MNDPRPTEPQLVSYTHIVYGLHALSVVIALTTAATVVGQEINANHLRPVPEGGTVEGTARPIHLGSRSQVWGIEIVDAQRRLVCVSRITLAVIARP